jgi:hypothetical protein
MTTAHRQLLTEVVAVLTAADVAGGRVYSARTRAISSDSPHGVVVRLARSASLLASVVGGRTGWRTLIQIECYGRMVGGTPDEASDFLVEQVFAVLAVNPTLNNLAQGVEPLEGDTLDWDYDEMDTSLACTTAKFIVSHKTIGRTLTS